MKVWCAETDEPLPMSSQTDGNLVLEGRRQSLPVITFSIFFIHLFLLVISDHVDASHELITQIIILCCVVCRSLFFGEHSRVKTVAIKCACCQSNQSGIGWLHNTNTVAHAFNHWSDKSYWTTYMTKGKSF